DVEPHGAIETEHLVQQHVSQFVLEHFSVSVRSKVSILATGSCVCLDYTVQELTQALFAFAAADCATEIFGGDDGGGVEAPSVRDLDAALLKNGLAGLPVGLHHITTLPGDFVIGMHAFRGKNPLNCDAPILARTFFVGRT